MARDTTLAIQAELVANVLSVDVEVGGVVAPGDTLVLLESMKMEIPVLAEVAAVVSAVKVSPGDVVQEGDVLVEVVPS
jgi:biotin carboxyl carrier protein